jgi:hypothetical protein
MPPYDDADAVYRLILEYDDRDVVDLAGPQADRKQTVARVGRVIRQHADGGALQSVRLQRGRRRTLTVPPAEARAARPPAAQIEVDWTTIEQWGSPVIRRVLQQAGSRPSSRRTVAPPCVRAAPCSSSPVSPVRPRVARSAPAAALAAPRRATGAPPVRRRGRGPTLADIVTPIVRNEPILGHRWHVSLALTLVFTAWLVLSAMLTGGQPTALLRLARTPAPATVTELPFDYRSSALEPPAPVLHHGSAIRFAE